MATRSVVVGSTVGLHARPAALIADAVTRLGRTVTIAVPGGARVDAGSALLIMTLGARLGDTVEVSGDDEEAVAVIAGLVEQDLDE
jgi:phosphocarrier protein